MPGYSLKLHYTTRLDKEVGLIHAFIRLRRIMENNRKTILFVEDNPFILAVYQNWLEREGFQVESAEDGLIALEKLPQMKPALVILDLMLPKLDGLDVLKYIREDAELSATPVMILSNAFMDERSAKAMTAGATK